MASQSTIFDTLIVVKRSGQRTTFQEEKIAIAIQKAFNSSKIAYKDEDVNKIYEQVLNTIKKEYKDRKTINIENIQDIIEETLKSKGFQEVYHCFSVYREQRNISRKTFVVKQQHKFLKAIERLGLNNLDESNFNANPGEIQKKFGNTISYEFAKAYLLDNKIIRSHDDGQIFIHSIETIPTSIIDSMELDLQEIESLDTKLASKLREKTTITSYLIEINNLLRTLATEIHGNVTFPHFDVDLKNIILKQFKKTLEDYSNLYFTTTQLDKNIAYDKITKYIYNLTDLEIDKNELSRIFQNNQFLELAFHTIIQTSLSDTKKLTIEALKNFFSFNYPMYIGINFGTDISLLGRIASNCIMKAKTQNPKIHFFFKVKKGINLQEKDINYDLYKTYQSLSLSSNFCYYVFLDTKFNQYAEETCYFPFGQRVMEDNTTLDKKIVGGKGNLATVSIDLARIALKCQKKDHNNMKNFYSELDQALQLATEALLTCFDLECSRNSKNFPILLNNGLWHDGDKIKETDRLRKVFKHGILTVNCCGLEEACIALTKNNENNEKNEMIEMALHILNYINKQLKDKSNNNNLNFTLSINNDEIISTIFKKQDTAIYGKVTKVTDKDKYQFNYFNTNDLSTIAKFQKYTLGGHLYTRKITNTKELDHLLKEMVNNNIGCFRPINKAMES